MTREDLYKSDRGERDYYMNTTDDEMLLPLTNDGFEALLEVAAGEYDLPVDDRARSLLAGYIHHIPSDVTTIVFSRMSRAIYKSYVNSMTYDLDQAAKKRASDEAIKKMSDPNVVPINKEQNGVQG